ncbi:hypothetical protein P3576_22620 [Vibrio parahaemolyticus]|uniref:hypothetical protein n=2 Tax=Vibrio parahaemolyticus TaxID=670 RepID=UPI000424D8C6|nr:hypothetical protein [Vibrio parahaemolyticus]EHH2535247.1 hypothetical protein [Vibrio parahaemolyticus]ELA8088849.1 hypothetical protein [Vibrio parahaemolyticus]ELA8205955.1 hypothetical protein [Vibrio parahaemolyticus]ELB2030902.1 hypothetical protein [Vibrio parahaemolyticus]ELB2142177.1 hypothetical protein [Vibrio parahaemolyticus]
MKIEYIILFIVWFLSLVSVLGVGYALSGAQESLSGINVTNGLTVFIAISNVISGLAAMGTLMVIVVARNDWLKPKTNDVILDLKLAVQAWGQSRVALNFAVFDGSFGIKSAYADNTEAVALHLEELRCHIDNERELWTQTSLLIEKYRFFFPSKNFQLIEQLQKVRESLYIETMFFLHSVENRVESVFDLCVVKRNKGEQYNSLQEVLDRLGACLEPGN